MDPQKISERAALMTSPEERIAFLLRESYRIKQADRAFFETTVHGCLRESRQRGFRRGTGMATVCLGILAFMDFRLPEASASLEKGSAILRVASPDEPMIGVAENCLGIIYGDLGQTERAFLHLAAARAHADRLGDRALHSMVLGNLSKLHEDLGQGPIARRLKAEALEVSIAAGDDHLRAINTCNLGISDLQSGDLPGAERLLFSALELIESKGFTHLLPNLVNELGVLAERKGDIPEAVRRFEQSIGLHEAHHDLTGNLLCRKARATLLGKQGRLPEALAELGTVIRKAEEANLAQVLLEGLKAQAPLLEEAGDYPEACACLKRILDLEAGLSRGKAAGNIDHIELESLREQNAILDDIRERGARIAAYAGDGDILEAMAPAVFDFTRASIFGIATARGERLALRSMRAGSASIRELEFAGPADGHLPGLCISSSEEIVIADLESEYERYLPSFPGEEAALLPGGLRSIACLPLPDAGILPSCLFLGFLEPRAIPVSRLPSIRLLAHFIAIGVRNNAAISSLTEERNLLLEHSSTDPLTGLLNRRGFSERAAVLHDLAVRNKFSFFLLMADLDNFKQVNDVHGHSVGDEVIAAAARRLQEIFRRESDICCRFGGEEFVVAACNVEESAFISLAERLLESIRSTEIRTASGPLRISVSLGMAGGMPSRDKAEIQSLLEAADRALYRSKRAGKDRLTLASGMDAP